VNLFRDGKLLAHWEEGRWAAPGFYDLMNSEVRHCEVVDDRSILFEFENGITMHLEDSSDQYECLQISFKGERAQWII
jgi:hypothetical protein